MKFLSHAFPWRKQDAGMVEHVAAVFSLSCRDPSALQHHLLRELHDELHYREDWCLLSRSRKRCCYCPASYPSKDGLIRLSLFCDELADPLRIPRRIAPPMMAAQCTTVRNNNVSRTGRLSGEREVIAHRCRVHRLRPRLEQ